MTTVQGGARPAEPLLASSLLGDGELDGLVEGMCHVGLKRRRGGEERLGMGVESVDDALSGGLCSGRVVSVSGQGMGGNEVCGEKVLV